MKITNRIMLTMLSVFLIITLSAVFMFGWYFLTHLQQMEMDSELLEQQWISLLVFTAVFLIFAVSLVTSVLILLNQRFLRPIEQFTEAVRQLDPGQNQQIAFNRKASPELSLLGQTINDLLNMLQIERRQLQASENYLRTLYEQAPIGITISRPDRSLVDVNPAFSRLIGYPRRQLQQMHFQDIVHPDEPTVKPEAFAGLLAETIDQYSCERRFLRADGQTLWVQMTVARLDRLPGGQPLIMCMVDDISEAKQQLADLAESERSKDVMLQNLPGMAYRCLFDSHYTMQFVSQGCQALTGYPPESLLGNREISYNDLIDPLYRDHIRQLWEECLAARLPFQAEYPIRTANGQTRWLYEQGIGLYHPDGSVEALEGLIIDVTTRKLHEQQIEYLNQHDVLTGVYNRRYFEQVLQQASEQEQVPMTVMIADINGLKLVNDAFGHQVGDSLIEATARILQDCCRESDMIARTGGDEFIILMPGTTDQTAYSVMREIQQAVIRYNQVKADREGNISLSLGYATRTESHQVLADVLEQAIDHMQRRKLLEKRSSQSAILASIVATLSARSQETEDHAERLADLSGKVGMRLGLSQFDLDKLVLLARLHDVGKINISDEILNKPGPLSAEEWQEMKKHPEIGYRIAAALPNLAVIADLILAHHERWDGKGYPQGLAGDAIPLPARILAVADAYDAMTQDRPYRSALPQEQALTEISRFAGSQFDPQVAKVFIDLMSPEISEIRPAD